MSLGGGHRLVTQLVLGFARSSMINSINLAVPKTVAESLKRDLKSIPKINLVQVESPLVKWIVDRHTSNRLFPGTYFAKSILKKMLNNWVEFDQWQSEFILKISKRYELVHCIWPHFYRFPNVNTPISCTIQDLIIFDFPELVGATVANAERQRLSKWIHNSDQLVVTANYNKKRIIKEFQADPKKIKVIRQDALPDKPINSTINIHEIFKKLPNEYAIYPANLSPHKNHYNLLIAWSQIRKKFNLPIVFIGYKTDTLNFVDRDLIIDFDWNQLRLISLIKRLELTVNTDFYAFGFIDDKYVIPLIKKAKLLVMPSLAEGGGSYPVEEALQLGIPVSCSDIPVMQEHLENRDSNICWFDPYRPDSIVKAIVKLLDNYTKTKIRSQNISMCLRPSWDSISSKYIDMFKELIG